MPEAVMEQETNLYRSIETRVREVITETPTIKTLRLEPLESIAFTAGQFVGLTIPGVGEAPFTPSSHSESRDVIELTIMRVGRVTEAVHRLRGGETVGLRGPFGNGYELEEFRDRDVLVVGGGCGFAPLRSLMYSFFDISDRLRRLVFRGGCRSPQELLYREELMEWSQRPGLDFDLTVDVGDSGWTGHVGVVTTLLDHIDIDATNAKAVVCGPPLMMKYTTRKLLEIGFTPNDVYVSMEQNMSCGIGKCGHCRIGTYYCCKDGPVFQYGKIQNLLGIWD
jgi:sulfite reductase subunit B